MPGVGSARGGGPVFQVFHHRPAFDDRCHPLRLGQQTYVLERVARYQNQIGLFAFLHRADAVRQAEQFGVGAGGGEDGLARADMLRFEDDLPRPAGPTLEMIPSRTSTSMSPCRPVPVQSNRLASRMTRPLIRSPVAARRAVQAQFIHGKPPRLRK